ncbi:MAG: crossover junction endodeoxyribonuclease RuvC, partial [Selenomonadaceae bacterium]|nr:crossover junction endodeoxyribonuclease RuvC [Selenomonadaceae bacterium]
MLALGIDPGTAICGYGVVEQSRGRLIAKTFGAITTSPQALMQDRLLKIYNELDAIIKNFQPEVMGVEKLFFGKNATTAIPVGQARGV